LSLVRTGRRVSRYLLVLEGPDLAGSDHRGGGSARRPISGCLSWSAGPPLLAAALRNYAGIVGAAAAAAERTRVGKPAHCARRIDRRLYMPESVHWNVARPRAPWIGTAGIRQAAVIVAAGSSGGSPRDPISRPRPEHRLFLKAVRVSRRTRIPSRRSLELPLLRSPQPRVPSPRPRLGSNSGTDRRPRPNGAIGDTDLNALAHRRHQKTCPRNHDPHPSGATRTRAKAQQGCQGRRQTLHRAKPATAQKGSPAATAFATPWPDPELISRVTPLLKTADVEARSRRSPSTPRSRSAQRPRLGGLRLGLGRRPGAAPSPQGR